MEDAIKRLDRSAQDWLRREVSAHLNEHNTGIGAIIITYVDDDISFHHNGSRENTIALLKEVLVAVENGYEDEEETQTEVIPHDGN